MIADSDQPPKPPDVLTVQEAASLLRISRASVERHYADLGGFRVGARILIPRSAVEDRLRLRDVPSYAPGLRA